MAKETGQDTKRSLRIIDNLTHRLKKYKEMKSKIMAYEVRETISDNLTILKTFQPDTSYFSDEKMAEFENLMTPVLQDKLIAADLKNKIIKQYGYLIHLNGLLKNLHAMNQMITKLNTQPLSTSNKNVLIGEITRIHNGQEFKESQEHIASMPINAPSYEVRYSALKPEF